MDVIKLQTEETKQVEKENSSPNVYKERKKLKNAFNCISEIRQCVHYCTKLLFNLNSAFPQPMSNA